MDNVWLSKKEGQKKHGKKLRAAKENRDSEVKLVGAGNERAALRLLFVMVTLVFLLAGGPETDRAQRPGPEPSLGGLRPCTRTHPKGIQKFVADYQSTLRRSA
jgi:hypothetical protein